MGFLRPFAAAFVLLAAAVLAGCAQPTQVPEETGLQLEATQTTGVIAGVVVDQAIRPSPTSRSLLAGRRP